MFPSPASALPLPPRPDLEQYRALAKELVRACAADELSATSAIGVWAERWLEALRRSSDKPDSESVRHEMRGVARQLAEFATAKLTGGQRRCTLSDAQFVLARSHGFDDWPKFAAHVDALAHRSGPPAEFEAAADAIVAGNETELRRLLDANPRLVHARSQREHRSTLLHYVAANGVEDWRQITPGNIVAIARTLLGAGAEVDAESDVYGGKCTTLGLAATSVHPYLAGVQEPLMQLLLDRGADVNRPDMVGNGHSTIVGCLANGRGEAAAFLARRGARLGLVEAAGVGRLDVVKTFFDERGAVKPGVAPPDLVDALLYATGWGHRDVVSWLLDHGAALGSQDADRQTALHWAAMGADLAMVELLIARGASLGARNVYGATVLDQAIWSAAHGGDADDFVPVLEALIIAGAQVPKAHPPVNEKVDAVLARHGSEADPRRHWPEEVP